MAPGPLRIVSWWSDAIGHLSHDPVLKGVLDTLEPGVGLHENKRLLPTMYRAVCGQQVTNSCALALHQRLLEDIPESYGDLAIAEHFSAMTVEQLQTFGMTRTKALGIQSLSAAFREGIISRESLDALDDRACEKQLTALEGIGPWTAQMIMIFGLNRPDILALSDYGVQQGAQALFREGEAWTARTASWKPFRTAATWLIWRSRTPVPVVY